jgi:predicted RNA-binding Zn ribbon-like protein
MSGTPWRAIARYGVRPAPGGLALVHDLLNTRAIGEKDVDSLGDGRRATQWMRTVVRAWARMTGRRCPSQVLTDTDAAQLRRLRDNLLRSLTALPGEAEDVGRATLELAGTGELSWTPSGVGWRWVYGAVLGEVLLSQHAGTWPRLKQCPNPACGAIFYDSTWNSGAVWHNAGTCGRTTRQLRV